jgi:probable selenium-dependent hydroxylase accessory protein YqeC
MSRKSNEAADVALQSTTWNASVCPEAALSIIRMTPIMWAMPSPVADAFRIGPRDVVTLVGSGGKTTTLYRLARELQHRGRGAVITTTTHILAPRPAPDLEMIVAAEPGLALAGCLAAVGAGRIPVLGSGVMHDGRLAGVPPELVDACAAQPELSYVVVEADGASRKPFKAPLGHEPVVPLSTTLLVAIVGADALGQPLDAEHVHRSQRVAELTGARLGQPLTAETIAAVLLHSNGPLRDAPSGARVLVLINKADTPARCAAAEAIALAVEARGGPRSLIGAVAADTPFGSSDAHA